jgi:nitrogen regulatory protein P-II 1
MKLVIAVIHPVRLRAAKEALDQIEVQRITICDSQEWIQPPRMLGSRALGKFQASIKRMITLEIAVNDDFLLRTINAIERVSSVMRGQPLDSGAIYVLPLENAWSFFPICSGKGAI